MKIVRLVDASDGGSRIEEMEVALAEPYVDPVGNTHPRTRSFTAPARIVELPAGLSQDWHGPPNRRIVIVLRGTVEVETTDGRVRRSEPGDVVLADDRKGKGHRTRVVDGPARLLFLEVGEEFDPEAWARP